MYKATHEALSRVFMRPWNHGIDAGQEQAKLLQDTFTNDSHGVVDSSYERWIMDDRQHSLFANDARIYFCLYYNLYTK